jgi:hypothetical protein
MNQKLISEKQKEEKMNKFAAFGLLFSVLLFSSVAFSECKYSTQDTYSYMEGGREVIAVKISRQMCNIGDGSPYYYYEFFNKAYHPVYFKYRIFFTNGTFLEDTIYMSARRKKDIKCDECGGYWNKTAKEVSGFKIMSIDHKEEE